MTMKKCERTIQLYVQGSMGLAILSINCISILFLKIIDITKHTKRQRYYKIENFRVHHQYNNITIITCSFITYILENNYLL